jgi:hypothetical protein
MLYISPQHPSTSTIEKQATSCRLDVTSQRLQERGLSEQATKLVCASWTKGTEKQYKSMWAKWNSWCCTQQIDPLQATPEQAGSLFYFSLFSGGEKLQYTQLVHISYYFHSPFNSMV